MANVEMTRAEKRTIFNRLRAVGCWHYGSFLKSRKQLELIEKGMHRKDAKRLAWQHVEELFRHSDNEDMFRRKTKLVAEKLTKLDETAAATAWEVFWRWAELHVGAPIETLRVMLYESPTLGHTCLAVKALTDTEEFLGDVATAFREAAEALAVCKATNELRWVREEITEAARFVAQVERKGATPFLVLNPEAYGLAALSDKAKGTATEQEVRGFAELSSVRRSKQSWQRRLAGWLQQP